MRRIRVAYFAVLLIAAFLVNVSGISAADSVGAYATVSSDGSCSVTLMVTLRLEQPEEGLKFPLPANAYGITLNGSRVRTQVSGGSRLVDLSDIFGKVAGSASLTLNYSLDNIVHTTQTGELELQLPLLSGFDYPVEALEFSVTLPGEAEEKPRFSSGYHQANIEKDLVYSVTGATITGHATQELKDHETLDLFLTVKEEQFPQTTIVLPDFDSLNTASVIAAALALLYWLFFLRNTLPRSQPNPTGPEGYGAGELGSILTLQGADLSMMVFSWAQLGYVHLQWARGRVLIHKRMDMGNERSGFEQRCFRNLFGKRQVVDTESMQYALLCRQVAKMTPNVQPLVRHRSGNSKLFRVLAGLIGLFSGVNLGVLLSAGAALQWFVVFLLAVAGFISSLYLQRWAECLFLRKKEELVRSLAICAGWLLLSTAAGAPTVTLWVIVSQGIAGFMAAYGGRRTESGRQVIGEVLGLRRYFRTVSREQLQHICQSNPEYFFTMIPEALALGVDKAFAKRFGAMRLPACPYLTEGTMRQMTAAQWSQVLRGTVKAMDARKRKMPMEKLVSLLQGFVK